MTEKPVLLAKTFLKGCLIFLSSKSFDTNKIFTKLNPSGMNDPDELLNFLNDNK
jgi:hypothetical protein